VLLKEAAEIAGIAKPRPYPICSTGRSSWCRQVRASWISRSWMMAQGLRDFSRLQCACSLSQVTPSTAA
jgi:hypothetical protein